MYNKGKTQSTPPPTKRNGEVENNNLNDKFETQFQGNSFQTINKIDITKDLIKEIKKSKIVNASVASELKAKDKADTITLFEEKSELDLIDDEESGKAAWKEEASDVNIKNQEIIAEDISSLEDSNSTESKQISGLEEKDGESLASENIAKRHRGGTIAKGKKSKKKAKIITIIIILILLIGVGISLMFFVINKSDSIASASEVTNPLTGEEITAELPARPIIVSIDNAEGARPQSGISKADIVYEFPTEGNIPRLQGVFYSEFPERVAPVRSVRNYFVDLAREFKGIHVGFGVSPQASDYLKSGVVPYVNPNTYEDIADDDMFWRDEARPSGVHNVYTNLNDIYEMNKTVEWQSPQILRSYPRYGTNLSEEEKKKEEESLDSEVGATTINMSYVGEDIEYTYDSETELYTRWVDGELAVDFEDQTPITAANVIVQFVSVGMLDEQRLDIDLTKGGQCLVFAKGKVFVGNWSRISLDDPTVFYREMKNIEGESYNKEIKLSVGNTWVQVINEDYSDEVLYL